MAICSELKGHDTAGGGMAFRLREQSPDAAVGPLGIKSKLEFQLQLTPKLELEQEFKLELKPEFKLEPKLESKLKLKCESKLELEPGFKLELEPKFELKPRAKSGFELGGDGRGREQCGGFTAW
jgi:hypothetical protein